MNSRTSRIIFGSALSIAAIAVAIDHTKHPLPEPLAATKPAATGDQGGSDIVDDQSDEAPCSMGEAPCSMGEAPCSMD